MEIRHFRYFIALAESLNFHKASRQLHLAQPSLSAQIKQLEQELGVPLLTRTRGDNQLTPAGKAFLEMARGVLAMTERAAAVARRAASGEEGTIRLGFVPVASLNVLPVLLRKISQILPLARVELREESSASLLIALESDALDLGITQLREFPLGYETVLIHREKLVVTLPRNHPLSKKRSIRPRDLIQGTVFLPGSQSHPALHRSMIEVFEADGHHPHTVQILEQVLTVASLTAEGLGISLVPTSVQDLRIEGLVYRPLRGIYPETELVALWSKKNSDPLLARVARIVSEMRLSTKTV